MAERGWMAVLVLALALALALGCGADGRDAAGADGRAGAALPAGADPRRAADGAASDDSAAAGGEGAVRRVELSSLLRQPVPLESADGALSLPGTAAGIRDRLGAPRSVDREAVQNRHDPAQTDTILTLRYPGLEAEIYRVGASGTELLTRVSLTGEGWWLAPGLGVGAGRAHVQRALGEPYQEENGTLVYFCTDCSELGGESLDVSMSAGVVRRLTLNFPPD